MESQNNLTICSSCAAKDTEIARLKAELALIREAAADTSLSDGAVRAVAAGLQEPTADDIAWAKDVLKRGGSGSTASTD